MNVKELLSLKGKVILFRLKRNKYGVEIIARNNKNKMKNSIKLIVTLYNDMIKELDDIDHLINWPTIEVLLSYMINLEERKISHL